MAQPTRRWVLLILSAAILSACSKHSQPSPQVYFQTVRAEFQRGDLVAAQAEADRAYEQYQKTNPDWAWRFRVLQAETLVWQGLSKNALTLLDAELPASLSTDEAAVRRKITRGLAYTFLQQFAEAENQLGEAEKLASKNQPKLLGEVALSQGTLLVLREEFQASEAAFLRALKLARQENLHFLEANAMGSLGLVNMKMQHYGEAIDWYKASSKLAESLGARTVMAKNTGNMGWCFYRIGNLDSARKLFTEADGLSEQLGLQKDELRWLTNLGVMYYDRREFDAAQDYYQRALRIAKQLDDKLDTAISLDNLALIAIKQQKLDDAERYNQEALSLQGTGISRLYSVYNDGKISAGRKNFKRAESLLQHVIQKSERDFSLRLDAETALAELYVTLKQSLPAEQTYQRALATISQARSTLKQDEYKLTFLANTIDVYDDYVAYLVSRGRNGQALRLVETNRAQTLIEGLRLARTTNFTDSKVFQSEGVAKRANAIVLSYWLAPEHSYLWAITPSRTAMFVLPGESVINQTVESYRKTLAGPRDPREIADANGQKLYNMLVAPAQKLIPKGSHIAVIPSGSLYELNFETLLVPDPQLHYWIEDVVITNASSLLLLRGSASAQEGFADKRLLLIGDPVSPLYPPLPQAASEVERVKQYFPPDQVQTYSGKNATAQAYLKGDPGSFSYIHFVAHGVASRASPLDSAVILSGEESSYKLYARDIVGKRLHAKLVTISSCEGASGRTYAGEGLVGLSWAFLRAGAHQVVAALWEVDDTSTPQFMDRFYAEINAGRDPAVALRTAKLALLHSDGIYRRPFYWAPFQLYKGL